MKTRKIKIFGIITTLLSGVVLGFASFQNRVSGSSISECDEYNRYCAEIGECDKKYKGDQAVACRKAVPRSPRPKNCGGCVSVQ